MKLHPLVVQLEKKTRDERKEVILDWLTEKKVSYILQEIHDKKNSGTNIIVRYKGSANKRLMIGAHYDPYPGAGAANDNGSGVAILTKLIDCFEDSNNHYSIDFVFFDGEESGMWGSKYYLSKIDKNNIVGMINLDMCGTGDTIIFDHKKALESFLPTICSQVCSELSIPFKALQRIPPGDDYQFEKVGIATISIGIIPKHLIGFIKRLALLIHPKWSLTKKNSNLHWRRLLLIPLVLPRFIFQPSLISVMHKPTDTANLVTENALETVYSVVMHLINGIMLKAL